MVIRSFLASAGAGLLLVLLGPTAASAEPAPTASLTGCTATVVTVDKDGKEVSKLTAPTTDGASSSNPLVVEYDGRASYEGKSDDVITDHKWIAKVDGIPVAAGGSANEDKETTAKDDVVLSEVLPFKVTGLYYVDVNIKGTGGECSGAIWLKLAGNPLTTLPFWLSAGLALLGLLGFWWAWPGSAPDGTPQRHPIRGILAGLVLALGVIPLLMVTGLAAFTMWWPFALIIVGLPVLGVLIGLFANAAPEPVPAE